MRTIPPRSRPSLEQAASGVPFLSRALEALAVIAAEAPLTEPLIGALRRATDEPGQPEDSLDLLEHWQSRAPGHPRSETRYRWELSHQRGTPPPPYAPRPVAWTAWRPSEQPRLERAPFAFEAELITPIVLSENGELLAELSAREDRAGELARELLTEALPIFRRDLARHVQLGAPWEDTFALWCLTRRPRMLELLHPIAVAISSSYAADCGAAVEGARFPFHAKPLASASAQLSSSLLLMGMDLDQAAALADFVRCARRPTGAWGDVEEPDDVLTTLVCAELLGKIDPGFEPAGTISFLQEAQGEDDLWRALGPDAPWLTAEVVRWVAGAERPFAERFQWPHRTPGMRDQKTGLPFFAYFLELSHLFSALPALAQSPLEIVFIDLIGFRAFNNAYGQAAGDDVLALFASAIESLPLTRAIRDGGDEFLVIGAPGAGGLRQTMESFRQSWPDTFRARFGDDVPPVAPRILLGRCEGRGLRRAREELGRGITGLKEMASEDPATGLLVEA